MIENRLVGMKSRGVYETPGARYCTMPTPYLKALHWIATFQYKQQVAIKYAELVYDGKWYTPLRRR